jgi:hypothetical protein
MVRRRAPLRRLGGDRRGARRVREPHHRELDHGDVGEYRPEFDRDQPRDAVDDHDTGPLHAPAALGRD